MTLLERTAAYLRANPDRWIRATEFEAVGGRQAWRTRLSECRQRLGMTIDQRNRYVTDLAGTRYTISEYRYRPPTATTETPENTVAPPVGDAGRLF